MNTLLIIFLLPVILILLFFFLIAPARVDSRLRASFFGCRFAHRGLHAKDKSVPENSLAAFRLAVEAGYGIELDIRFTKIRGADGVMNGEVEIVDMTNNLVLNTYNINFFEIEV